MEVLQQLAVFLKRTYVQAVQSVAVLILALVTHSPPMNRGAFSSPKKLMMLQKFFYKHISPQY